MKNQYVGDINDYRKYGLLRLLGGGGPGLGVCWMLTPDDDSADGGKTGYLGRPEAWREHDPALFDRLAEGVGGGQVQDVEWVEHMGLLPGALFHRDPLPEDAAARRAWFAVMLERFAATRLVFFDPDNGLEVPSVPFGSRGSSRYLYWDELTRAFGAGHSVLVYQHFPRAERAAYVARRRAELTRRTGAAVTMAFSTAHVVFLLASQAQDRATLERRANAVARAWSGQIEVVQGGP